MRSVNVAELKNQLSKYLTFAKGGEEVVIRDRNLPVAKLVPFSAEGADENGTDRKSTRLNSSHGYISYAVFCLKKKTKATIHHNTADMEQLASIRFRSW